MLALKRSELAREMCETEQRLVQVEARLAQLEQGDGPSPYEIVVKSVAAMPVASLKQWMPHDNEMSTYCKSLTHNLFRKLKAARIAWSGLELILYHAEEYQETDLDVEACVVLPEPLAESVEVDEEVHFRELSGHEMLASLIYEGPFIEMIPAELKLLRWVGFHQHVPVCELHLSGPAHPDKLSLEISIVELQFPIAGME